MDATPARVGYILGAQVEFVSSVSFSSIILMKRMWQESVCHLTTAAAVLVWGRFSDHNGRKPVLLACCFGLGISLIGFGSSRTITSMIVWKAFQGMFKANKPIIKTATAELTNGNEIGMAKIYGIMPAIYAAAATAG